MKKKVIGDMRKCITKYTDDEHTINCIFTSSFEKTKIQESLKRLVELGISIVTDEDSYQCTICKDENDEYYVEIWAKEIESNGFEFEFIANDFIVLTYALPKFLVAIKEAKFYEL